MLHVTHVYPGRLRIKTGMRRIVDLHHRHHPPILMLKDVAVEDEEAELSISWSIPESNRALRLRWMPSRRSACDPTKSFTYSHADPESGRMFRGVTMRQRLYCADQSLSLDFLTCRNPTPIQPAQGYLQTRFRCLDLI